MGMTLPYPDSPAEQARALAAQKKAAEDELEIQFEILRANKSTMHSRLVDDEGFPRDDIDIYAVRGARKRAIELRNDLEKFTIHIGKALEGVYGNSNASSSANPISVESGQESAMNAEDLEPFARVNGVAPGSPSADAGLQREDLILAFGSLRAASFSAGSLQPVAVYVNQHENRPILLMIRRSEELLSLHLTPRSGWGGRGMLGCHIVPYSA